MGNKILMGVDDQTGSYGQLEVKDTFKIACLTTQERDALNVTNGTIIYNTDTNKFEGRANDQWVAL